MKQAIKIFYPKKDYKNHKVSKGNIDAGKKISFTFFQKRIQIADVF